MPELLAGPEVDGDVPVADDGALRWPDMSRDWPSPVSTSCVESAVLGAVLVRGVAEGGEEIIENFGDERVGVEGAVFGAVLDAANSCLENTGLGAVLAGEIAEGGDAVVAVGLAVVDVDKHRIDGRSCGRVDDVLVEVASGGEIEVVFGVDAVIVFTCLAVADEGVLDVFLSLIFSFRA